MRIELGDVQEHEEHDFFWCSDGRKRCAPPSGDASIAVKMPVLVFLEIADGCLGVTAIDGAEIGPDTLTMLELQGLPMEFFIVAVLL